MASSVREQRKVFMAIANGPDDFQLRQEFLKPLSRKQVKAIAEVAANVLYGTIGLSSSKKNILRPIRNFLRSLASQDVGPGVRKKIILTHPNETFVLVKTVFKNLEDLIWRAN